MTAGSDLPALILEARRVQRAARLNCARSANADTLAAVRLANRELDVLLDRLLLRGAK